MWVVWVWNLDPFICNIVSIHTYLLRYPFLLCRGTGLKLFYWGFFPCDSWNKLSAWWKALIWFSLDFYMFCFGCSWRDWWDFVLIYFFWHKGRRRQASLQKRRFFSLNKKCIILGSKAIFDVSCSSGKVLTWRVGDTQTMLEFGAHALRLSISQMLCFSKHITVCFFFLMFLLWHSRQNNKCPRPRLFFNFPPFLWCS